MWFFSLLVFSVTNIFSVPTPVQQYADTIANKRIESICWDTIFPDNIQVLFIGERHDALKDKVYVAKLVKDLYGKGKITDLAIEMLRYEDNLSLYSYFTAPTEDDRRARRSVIYARLGRIWDEDFYGLSDKYMEFLDAIRPIRTIAIDYIPPDMLKPSTQDSIIKRNYYWAYFISKIIEAEKNAGTNARVLVYAGASHSGYGTGHNVNEILQRIYNISSRVVDFAGGSRTQRHAFYPYYSEEKVEYAASALNLSDKTFMVVPELEDGRRAADYMIHLPNLFHINSLRQM